jgi:hypothetical protein
MPLQSKSIVKMLSFMFCALHHENLKQSVLNIDQSQRSTLYPSNPSFKSPVRAIALP